MSSQNLIRLNKFIANSGICNRREADNYISDGRVTVNNKIINKLGSKVSLKDSIRFDGREVFPVKMKYLVLNKPKGFHCISQKANNKTIFSLLSSIDEIKGIVSLDFLKENYLGLIILSNDVKFMNQINLKRKSTKQIFHLKLDKFFLKKDLELIMNFEEKFKLKIKSISYVDRAERNEIGVELFLDSIKHLEKLFLELNYKIISCDRVLFSCLTKKDLTRGQWRDLTKQEIINLQSF